MSKADCPACDGRSCGRCDYYHDRIVVDAIDRSNFRHALRMSAILEKERNELKRIRKNSTMEK